MTALSVLRSEERKLTCSPIGMQVIDAFLNSTPIAPFEVYVDRLDGAQWNATSLIPTRTPSGMLTLPGLERQAVVMPGQPGRRYRLRINSDAYIPSYRRTADGFEFLAFPYNDTNPQFVPNQNVGLLALSPSAAYSYSSDVRVVRGQIAEMNGAPVRDATIVYPIGQVEAMSNAAGHFALGVKRAPLTGPLALDIHHDRTNRVRSVTLQLPAALESNQIITLN